MRSFRSFQLTAGVMLLVVAQTATAQVNQLNRGATGAQTNQGAGDAAGATAAGGGTTEGPAGVTTDGPGSSAAQDGGIAGGNISEVFVGGNNNSGFVGGGVQTQNNSNRQFRAINNTEVPTGSSRQQSGTPRRVPVAFRVAFSYPKADGTSLLIGESGTPIQNAVVARPELRSISVNIDANGVAVLSGHAPDAAAARLAANLVRLRPGIRRVDNQVAVAAE